MKARNLLLIGAGLLLAVIVVRAIAKRKAKTDPSIMATADATGYTSYTTPMVDY